MKTADLFAEVILIDDTNHRTQGTIGDLNISSLLNLFPTQSHYLRIHSISSEFFQVGYEEIFSGYAAGDKAESPT
jgi:hypothetical protein